jgi:phosphoribosylglycinamide formyltransferase-1
MIRIAIFASGKGSNFEAIAGLFRESDRVRVECLVCDQPDAGVIKIARSFGIEHIPVRSERYRTRLDETTERGLAASLEKKNIDLVVLAGYMRVVKKPMLEAFPGRIVNIHPSLLPAFRGLDAVRQALEYGVKITGCTVHFVDEQIDHGRIIAQSAVPVKDGDTEESLHRRIHREEHELYPRVIRDLATKMEEKR